jgi:hypothetical protein
MIMELLRIDTEIAELSDNVLEEESIPNKTKTEREYA